MTQTKKYVEVVLPVKFRDTVSYSVPNEILPSVKVGSRVDVMLGGRKFKGFVEAISDTPGYDKGKIRDILSVDESICAPPHTLKFWRAISSYYMCSSGEALKCASPFLMELNTKKRKLSEAKPTKDKAVEISPLPKCTPCVDSTLENINNLHDKGKRVLLHSPNEHSFDTILYLINKTLNCENRDVLILLPDIPTSRGFEKRLSQYFSNIITYHSGQTPAKRRDAVNRLIHEGEQHIVLGLRSALFLPFSKLGLIVVVDEGNPLYKQIDPAPRYNGRDVALMLADLLKTNIVLTSPFPSFEAHYNISVGKLSLVKGDGADVESLRDSVYIVDYLKEIKLTSVKGGIANRVLPPLEKAKSRGEKVVVYRPKWCFKDDWVGEGEWDLYEDVAEIEKLKIKPTNVLILHAEALISNKEIHSEEYALDILYRLYSVISHSSNPGKLYIQTNIIRHSVFKFLQSKIPLETLILERKGANFPPYSRIVHITLKGKDLSMLNSQSESLKRYIMMEGVDVINGPLPLGDSEVLLQLIIPKDKIGQSLKSRVYRLLSRYDNLTIDVDPL